MKNKMTRNTFVAVLYMEIVKITVKITIFPLNWNIVIGKFYHFHETLDDQKCIVIILNLRICIAERAYNLIF